MTTGLTIQAGSTVFDALVEALTGAAAYNRDDVVSPAAILWTDERREWESLGPRVRVVTAVSHAWFLRQGQSHWARHLAAICSGWTRS
jgi:hypothetical protein